MKKLMQWAAAAALSFVTLGSAAQDAAPAIPSPDGERRTFEVATNAIPGFGTYTYDGSGNITSIGDGTGQDTFIYDRIGRLAGATLRGNAGQAFTYDRYGNILTVTTTGDSVVKKLGVNPATNRVDQNYDAAGVPNNVVGQYDSRGRVTSVAPGRAFSWDALDTMKHADVDGVRRYHLYSASDERVVTIRSVGGTITGSDWSIRDPQGRVLRRFTESNDVLNWSEDYIYRGSQLLAAEVPTSEKVRHFHVDHLGTPRLITGNGGVQLAAHQYYPFGSEIGPSPDNEKAKFTGHERDADTLDYMHARYYDPSMGRFLSVDPVLSIKRSIREPQSWNRYAYVVNKPVGRIDPDGRVDGNSDDFARQLFPDDRAAQLEFDQDVAKKTATAAAFFGSLFTPGPEDLMIGTAAAALGGRLLARFATRFGPAVDACTCPAVFRGGESMAARLKDVKIVDGLVQPLRGVSLNAVAKNVEGFGGAYRVTSIPDGLQIIRVGPNPNKYEIVPKAAMPLEEFQKLLGQVKLEAVK